MSRSRDQDYEYPTQKFPAWKFCLSKKRIEYLENVYIIQNRYYASREMFCVSAKDIVFPEKVLAVRGKYCASRQGLEHPKGFVDPETILCVHKL